jgi:hypothetical protein
MVTTVAVVAVATRILLLVGLPTIVLTVGLPIAALLTLNERAL